MLNADYAGAAMLAAWKKRAKTGWPSVLVEHVESSGVVGGAAEAGALLSGRTFVSLGELPPTTYSSRSCTARSTDLELAESYDRGRCRFDGPIVLDRGVPSAISYG